MTSRAAIGRGFTLVELAAGVAAAAALLAGAAVALQPGDGSTPRVTPPSQGTKPSSSAGETARRLKDAHQVRIIVQAAIVFAGQNMDRLPLPSAIDQRDTTVSDKGRAKDTTANILSLMLFGGGFAPETCVSPAEASASIKADADYAYADPPKAVKPTDALWDPAFAADFTGGKTGNVSYAHLQTSDGRMHKWSNTFETTDPLFANRGPQIAEVTAAPGGPTKVRAAAPDSVTYRVHGPPETWEGNVAYADGHVTFHTTFLPADAKEAEQWPHYFNAAGRRTPDVIFFDETDDAGRPERDGQPAVPARSNAYLSIFIKAGEKPEDFTAIWD